jgi:hypothetical protein
VINACLFCGASGSGTLTNEHVNPRWLLHHLGLPDDDMLIQAVASSETGRLVESPRIQSSFNFVLGRVCGHCNNGWLRRLENAAKPLLISLMDQHRTLESMSVHEAALIGKWAAKTAYLHTWVGPLKQPVQVDHLRTLYGDAGTVRGGVGVFGMQSDFVKPSGYIQTGHWPQLGGTEATGTGETPAAAYKVGLQFRSLYLLVAFWPSAASVLTRVRNMHVRLVPRETENPDYDIRLDIGVGPIDRLVAFANWLAVWHSSLAV